MAITGTVSLSPVNAADHVTSRQVVVTINGIANPPAEGVLNPVVFTCNVGDAITVVDTDTNSAGSSPSPVFSTTAALPLLPPATPTVLGVVFSGTASAAKPA